MHPLIEDVKNLKDSEIENKVQTLSKRYFQTYNSTVQHQILLLLDAYKEELRVRREKSLKELYQKRDTDLDNLINVE